MKHVFSFFALLSFLLSSCSSSGGVKVHTVTFDTHGGSQVPSQRVKHGDKIEKPDNPTKLGYDFVNWTYKDEEWSFIGYSVTENMTLDANWYLVTYNITYILDGGTNNSSNPTTYTVEDEIVLANPYKYGYRFVGWYDDEGNQITTLGQTIACNLTLTAKWYDKANVTVYSSDNSLGTVSGGGEYKIFTNVTIQATPIGSAILLYWINEYNQVVSYSNSYVFYLSEKDCSFTAVFTVPPDKISKITFSDYDESLWHTYQDGSKIDREINGSELILNYYEFDPNNPSIGDGWGLECLSLGRGFVNGDAIRFKIKCSVPSISGNYLIQIIDKDGDWWVFYIPRSALQDDQYHEFVLPYYSAVCRADLSNGNHEIDFDYIRTINFGYELDFGAGSVSFKDFKIISVDENTIITIFNEEISYEAFRSIVFKNTIKSHSSASLYVYFNGGYRDDGTVLIIDDTFELEIVEYSLIDKDGNTVFAKRYSILNNGKYSDDDYNTLLHEIGGFPVDAGEAVKDNDIMGDYYIDSVYRNNPLSHSYSMGNKKTKTIIFDKDMCLKYIECQQHDEWSEYSNTYLIARTFYYD